MHWAAGLMILTALVFAGRATAADSGWNTHAPEATFVWHGKPIHPECVEALYTGLRNPPPVELNECMKPVNARGKLNPIERTGSEFSANNRKPDEYPAGWASYSVLANNGSRYLLLSNWSGGGTGTFSSILIAHLSDHALVLETEMTSGDRCNGGLRDFKFAGHVIRYSINLTPYDVIERAGPTRLRSYHDLDASAVSCVATEDMEYDLATGISKRVSVTLTGDWYTHMGAVLPLEVAPATSKENVNNCFDRLYNSYFEHGRVKLSTAGLAAFRRAFDRMCWKQNLEQRR